MATRIQVRRDTAANWAAAPTTVLASGEIGFESDTLQFKIGDGTAQWQNLEYAGGTTPIIQNASGTAISDLNDASLRNNGNAKYLILGADTVGNDPAGLTTATDGQLLVTVAKYDYLGTSAANERYLMTLTTMTTGKTYYRTYNGSWSAWYLVITGDTSGNVTLAGDLAVNGGDITTTSTGTATVFNTNATTLNVGQDATTVSIGATTGTATIRNATTAITGDATVGGSATVGTTLGVTGNTTLTGDLAVNGGDITTSAATATVFDSNATSVDIAGAATTLNIADAPTTAQTINIGTGATASGQTKTINIGTGGAAGSTTNINLGDADGGLTAINQNATIAGTLGVTGVTTLTGGLATQLAASNMSSGSILQLLFGSVTRVASVGVVVSGTKTITTASITPKKSGSTIYVLPLATSIKEEGNGIFKTDAVPGTLSGLPYQLLTIPCWFNCSNSTVSSGLTTTMSATRSAGSGTITLTNRNLSLGTGASGTSRNLLTWTLLTDSSVNTVARTYSLTITNSGAGAIDIGIGETTYVMIEVAS